MVKGPDSGPSEWPRHPVAREGHASPGMHTAWILAKTPTWPPAYLYCRAPRAAYFTRFIMSFSYSVTFCFPTSLPMIPKQHPMLQMIGIITALPAGSMLPYSSVVRAQP